MNDVTSRLSVIAGCTWAVGLVVALVLMACCLGCESEPPAPNHRVTLYESGNVVKSYETIGYVEQPSWGGPYTFVDAKSRRRLWVTGTITIEPK